MPQPTRSSVFSLLLNLGCNFAIKMFSKCQYSGASDYQHVDEQLGRILRMENGKF